MLSSKSGNVGRTSHFKHQCRCIRKHVALLVAWCPILLEVEMPNSSSHSSSHVCLHNLTTVLCAGVLVSKFPLWHSVCRDTLDSPTMRHVTYTTVYTEALLGVFVMYIAEGQVNLHGLRTYVLQWFSELEVYTVYIHPLVYCKTCLTEPCQQTS